MDTSHSSTQLDAQEQRDLDELMHNFYAVISFEHDATPDWVRMKDLFAPHARITRVTPEAIDYLDLSGFRNLAEEMMEVGAFTSFYEHEIARRTDRYGKVVHVASAYETKISATADDYIERGINSLQLVRDGGQWRILSLCWDDHAPFNTTGLKPVKAME
jgi:hypothetical protein